MATPRKKLVLHTIVPVVVILAIILGALYVIRSNLPESGRKSGSQKLDRVTPDFVVHRLDGSKSRLSEMGGKVYLVNFWATWCEACMVEMPSIVRLRESFKSRGFEVLAINLDESPSSVVPRAIRQFGIEFPILIDPQQEWSDFFDVHAIPFSVVLDAKRRILMVENGERDWNSSEVRQQVEKWLSD